MWWLTRYQSPQPLLTAARVLLAMMLTVVPFQAALALITGGEGNVPITDPGWPKGAASIFNHPSRSAWWEGPPFGGGQWHAECRGDAQALSTVLADFAKLAVKNKRIVLHDGVGQSFWLNPNREPANLERAKVDWIFMVWQEANWQRLRQMPVDLQPTDLGDKDSAPPSQIDVYTGGNVRWSDVVVPEGLQVIDERLESHGYTANDGNVLEGRCFELGTDRPMSARIQLQRIEPQPKGGYRYAIAVDMTADAQGQWVIKRAPDGWYRVVVEADRHAPRVAGYAKLDDQPRWRSYRCGLAPAAEVSGSVVDDVGQPLADVEARLMNVTAGNDGRYESPHEYQSRTDGDGRFHFDHVPVGSATVRLRRSGYCRPGLGQPITMPASDVVLHMMKAARVQVSVDFAGRSRPAAYIVHIEPEGGEVVGKWSGSGSINAENQITFEDIPPGPYVVRGQPNPSTADQQTKSVNVQLLGGQTAEVTLSAK